MSESVAYNWRVLRTDRQAMTALELAAVMAYFEDHQAAPPGYRIEAIDWRNPERTRGRRRVGAPRSTRDAADAMAGHFYYVLRGRLADVRVGSVKR